MKEVCLRGNKLMEEELMEENIIYCYIVDWVLSRFRKFRGDRSL